MAGETFETDVAIIGAGPVGLFAVFECGMLKLRCHVIDALDMIGGQCTALYPEKPIYDIPGYPAIDAAVLIERLEAQAAPFDPVYHLGQQVTSVTEVGEDRLDLVTSAGVTVRAKAVILAAGVGAFGPNRPPMEGLERFEGLGEGSGVNYLVKKRESFRDKHVVIAGGGDSALDWAVSLSGLAASVSLVHRRPKFRGAPDSVAKVHALAEDGSLDLVVPFQLHGLEGRDDRLEAVIVRALDGTERRLPADVLLPFYGLAMNLGPIAEWGLDLERGTIPVAPETCETNRAGIHAIGDIATYPGKLKLILCGFSEAAMTAHAIYKRVFPDQELHFEYSTTKGVPGAA